MKVTKKKSSLFLIFRGGQPGKPFEFPAEMGLIAVSQKLGCLALGDLGIAGEEKQSLLEPDLGAQLLGSYSHLAADDRLNVPGGV